MTEQRRKFCIFEKIVKHLQSHLAVKTSLSMILAVVLLAVILQSYVQSHYIRYVEDYSVSNETAVLNAIKDNANSALKNIIENGSELAVNSRLDTAIKSENAVSVYQFLQQQEYSTYVVAATIVGKDGIVQQYDRYRSTFYGTLWKDANVDKLMKMYTTIIDLCKTQNQFSFPRYKAFLDPETYRTMTIFHIAFPILAGTSTLSSISYVLVLTYDFDVMSKYISSVEIPQTDYISGYILDSNEMVLYGEDKELIGHRLEMLGNEKQSIISKPLDYLDWNIVAVIDQTKLKAQINHIYLNAIWILVILMAGYITLLMLFWNDIRIPIKSIVIAIRHNRDGEQDTKIDNIKGTHEIWQLAMEYNRMIDALQEQKCEVERQHKKAMQSLKNQYEAERKALESQISAHFICNTLGVINYEAIEANDEKASQMIKKLSNILRYTFDQSCQEVMIGQEVAWIEQYLFLEKERFENLFTYHIDYDERYSDWPACKMMFQPFVENAILHGFEDIESGGIINIVIKEQNGKLHIEITDNGKGISKEKEQEINNVINDPDPALHLYQPGKNVHIGIGITNAITRMRKFYGDDVVISMHTEINRGTEFTFDLPFPKDLVGDDEEND